MLGFMHLGYYKVSGLLQISLTRSLGYLGTEHRAFFFPRDKTVAREDTTEPGPNLIKKILA